MDSRQQFVRATSCLRQAIKELYRAKQIGVLPDCLRDEYEKQQAAATGRNVIIGCRAMTIYQNNSSSDDGICALSVAEKRELPSFVVLLIVTSSLNNPFPAVICMDKLLFCYRWLIVGGNHIG